MIVKEITKWIEKILEDHKHWINEDIDGWENMRADLRGANLYGANLYGANLNRDGSESDAYCVPSDYDPKFNYAVGGTVEVEDYDDNRWNECSTGIHFFINFREAVEY